MEMRKLGTSDVVYPSSGSGSADVWETLDGRRYCVSGWNGEKWLECWEVFPDMSTGPSFEASPAHRWEADGIDLSSLEENSPEWEKAIEIVGFKI